MGCGSSIQMPSTEAPLPGEREPFSENYKLGAKLGQGASGQVFIVRSVSYIDPHPQKRAVKVINVRGTLDDRGMVDACRLRRARREARLWQQVGEHGHCVRLFETFLDMDMSMFRCQYMMIMERCTCSMTDWLKGAPTVTVTELAGMFRQMLLGLEHVHRAGVVHRDVKPENILLGGEGRRVLKLADFGVAAQLPAKGPLKGICGSTVYMSPEMLLDVGYNAGTDMWSLGALGYVILYNDYVHSPPGEATPAAVQLATKMGCPQPTYARAKECGEVPAEAKAFVSSLLERDPELRCTATQALHLPFVKSAASATAAAPGPVRPPSDPGFKSLLPAWSVAAPQPCRRPPRGTSRAPMPEAAGQLLPTIGRGLSGASLVGAWGLSSSLESLQEAPGEESDEKPRPKARPQAQDSCAAAAAATADSLPGICPDMSLFKGFESQSSVVLEASAAEGSAHLAPTADSLPDPWPAIGAISADSLPGTWAFLASADALHRMLPPAAASVGPESPQWGSRSLDPEA